MHLYYTTQYKLGPETKGMPLCAQDQARGTVKKLYCMSMLPELDVGKNFTS